MSLFTPELGLIFWMLIAFLIVVFILGKFIWPPILKSIAERTAFIAKGVEDAEEAARRLQEAQTKEKELLDHAHSEQIRMLNETEQLKNQLIEEARQEASKERQKVLEQTNQAIAMAKLDAMKDVRKEVVKLSIQVSEKILRQDLDNKKAREQLIEKMVNELNINN